VHVIENVDAKMMMALGVTRGEIAGNAEGNWTEYQKAFGGRLFRPDTAPADAVESDIAEPAAPASGNAAPTLKLQINNPLFESNATKRK